MLRSNGPAKRRGRLGAPAGRAFPPGNDHQHPHPCIAAQARLRHAAQCGRCTTAGRCSARPGGQSLIKDSLFSTGRPVAPPLDEVEFTSHMQASALRGPQPGPKHVVGGRTTRRTALLKVFVRPVATIITHPKRECSPGRAPRWAPHRQANATVAQNLWLFHCTSRDPNQYPFHQSDHTG